MPTTTRRAEAMKNPTHHQFRPGIGYVAHSGAPRLPASSQGNNNCAPAPGTRAGTVHMMKPPGGAPAVAMKWQSGTWAPRHIGLGNRLAWTTEFLSRAGWEYAGPKG